MFALATFAVNP